MYQIIVLVMIIVGGTVLSNPCYGKIKDPITTNSKSVAQWQRHARDQKMRFAQREAARRNRMPRQQQIENPQPIPIPTPVRVSKAQMEEERQANHLFLLALMLNGRGQFEKQVIERLQYIVKEYPDTDAAKRAEKRLSHMKP